MIFAGNRRHSRPKDQERQYIQLADINRQRLMGYAESFRELAGSFREELGQELTAKSQDRLSLLEEQKHRENCQLISEHLKELAFIINSVAEKELCYEPLEQKKQKVLIHAMRAEGIFAETLCYLPHENTGQTLGMILYTEKRGGVASEEVADMLSVLLKCRLEASVTSPYVIDRKKRSFLFVEEAKLSVIVGLSKAVKETEGVSGDNFSVLQSETGRKTILLSDGTGSGKRANRDSGRVLDLMEKMLEAGFDTQTAVSMVNTAMFARGEESNHPTLDICGIDLYKGDCEIYKIGGAVSFLKRDKQVELIGQGTLPLGIFQTIQPQKISLRVQDGDYLVLVTDGCLDALGEDGEEVLAESLRNLTEHNPQEISEELLQLALKGCGGHIRDDMTFLVAGIWEN